MSLEFVTAVGVVIVFLYIAVILQIFFARLRNHFRTRRQDRVERLWLPILVGDAADVPKALPSLTSRDVIPFLTLWNQLQESFTGDITHHLNEVARRAGADLLARLMLEDGSAARAGSWPSRRSGTSATATTVTPGRRWSG